MAPSELAWQASVDRDGWRSTAPWPASGAEGLELRPRPQAPDWSWAFLRELRPGAEPRTVAEVGFHPDGWRWVEEQLPGGRWQRHDLPGRGSVRLRWEKAAGRWELWAETGGERLVLEATFGALPQLELYMDSAYVGLFDVCLLPLPGPGALQSPLSAHAQLQDLNTEKLQKANPLLTQKAQKSEMTQCILQLKEQCDAFLAFSSDNPQAEEGPGATPVSEDAVDSFTLVGDQSDMCSDTSSSAKCFLPNTALHGVDGHLLRVEKLKIGDRVRLLDQTEASVVGMHLHRAKKKPYNLVELTTRQGLSTVSKSHRVAVPSLASEGEACEAERADQLGVGNTVFVGGKQQKLTKVTSRQERTHLYEVRLEPDGPLEMLQLPSFGLVTFGSVASDQPDAEMDGGEAEA